MTNQLFQEATHREQIHLLSELKSAESYAVYKVVSKAVKQKSLDKVFDLNYAEGKKISVRRRMTQCTSQGNEAAAKIQVLTCK